MPALPKRSFSFVVPTWIVWVEPPLLEPELAEPVLPEPELLGAEEETWAMTVFGGLGMCCWRNGSFSGAPLSASRNPLESSDTGVPGSGGGSGGWRAAATVLA